MISFCWFVVGWMFGVWSLFTWGIWAYATLKKQLNKDRAERKVNYRRYYEREEA